MRTDRIHKGLRVVTNSGRWGTVETDPDDTGWFYVKEDGHGLVSQNGERVSPHGIMMPDGDYFPEYNDPRPIVPEPTTTTDEPTADPCHNLYCTTWTTSGGHPGHPANSIFCHEWVAIPTTDNVSTCSGCGSKFAVAT